MVCRICHEASFSRRVLKLTVPFKHARTHLLAVLVNEVVGFLQVVVNGSL